MNKWDIIDELAQEAREACKQGYNKDYVLEMLEQVDAQSTQALTDDEAHGYYMRHIAAMRKEKHMSEQTRKTTIGTNKQIEDAFGIVSPSEHALQREEKQSGIIQNAYGRKPTKNYNSRLMPCPHCGGEARFQDHSKTVIGGQTAIVAYARCPNCDARGKRARISDYESKAEAVEVAINAWNRRDGIVNGKQT